MKKKGSTGAAKTRTRLTLLRRRAKDVQAQVGPNPYREAWTKKAIVMGVTAGALCGPVALMMAVSGGTQAGAASATTPVASVDPVVLAGQQARATNVAQAFLRQWLTASQATANTISKELLTAPDTIALPQKAPAAPTSMTVADVAHPNPTTWLISFTVTGGASGAGETYQVPVQVDGWQAAVITLPSRVGEITAPAKIASQENILDPNSAAGQAATGFLKSWLTNAGDITRWTTADFTPAPVTTQLCRQVTLTNLSAPTQDEDALAAVPTAAPSSSASPSATPQAAPSPVVATGQVTATVTCTTAATSQPLTYRLALTEVAGQLVVSAVNPYSS